MIETICINDSDKPSEIPAGKWVKKGNKYHVIYTITVLPQKQLAFHLHEIELDESCVPYEYFLSSRFSFTTDGLFELMEMIQNCNDTSFSLDELLEQTEIDNSKSKAT